MSSFCRPYCLSSSSTCASAHSLPLVLMTKRSSTYTTRRSVAPLFLRKRQWSIVERSYPREVIACTNFASFGKALTRHFATYRCDGSKCLGLSLMMTQYDDTVTKVYLTASIIRQPFSWLCDTCLLVANKKINLCES